MQRRLSLFVICCIWLSCFVAEPSASQETTDTPDGVTWTAIIPDAFPRYVYTWQFGADGSYREDGHDAATGAAIQTTLVGRWSIDGPRMMLRQQGLPYVFDGVVLGGLYTGTLYLDDRAISRFCAAKGAHAPDDCGAKPDVAMMRGATASR